LLEWLDKPLLITAAVAYQFAKIGNDKKAGKLLKDLDEDEHLGDYIDCLGMSPGYDGDFSCLVLIKSY
jgi:hypothetical protein